MHCCKMNTKIHARCTFLIRQLSTPVNESVSKEFVKTQSTVNLSVLKENENKGIEPHYPPILDLSRRARQSRNREKWHNKVKSLGTIEEKIFELNMPRYYGWKAFTLKEGILPYDPLPQAQYITNTHIANEPKLPSYYDSVISLEILDASVQQIKSQVEDMLAFEYNYRKLDDQLNAENYRDKAFMDDLMGKTISQQMNKILSVNFSLTHAHLLESELDIDPRIEAFWFFGGLEVPSEVKKSRAGIKWTAEFKDESINMPLKYTGSPILHLRHCLPLKEIVSLQESENLSLEVPVEAYDLRKKGYFMDRLRATVIPGFWPGDHSEFGTVSYHKRGYLCHRPEVFNDNLDALKAQAVFGSFSWLYTQACYQGFSTFQNPTYPFVNQMIITNGQWWSFAVYQLNTTAMHIDVIDKNPRRNICWITEPMQLFEKIENGKVYGFNEDVLKHLIKFYVNTPEAKEGIEMKPYVQGEEFIANIEDPERRKWLENKYKHLLSNRMRHRLVPEIYHWQRIYLIKFKTRPLDKKREPWEFGINVFKRRLDDHASEYIPKHLRPDPKKHKQIYKWAKSYYPKVDGIDNDEIYGYKKTGKNYLRRG
ncbi:large ribosomal subunit protein mL65 [Phymastichus coffea]|uniref:large ribosomal subunit protein mL65 n=1 Tax=Phymastichus coffea TaxID=108790 RepID=UPI00273C9EFE|nr:large ribosomal subunit protein mL65 [Phymastichus coffea]